MENNKTRKIMYTLAVLLLLCIVINMAVYFLLGGYCGYDLIGHRKICAYSLMGYDPYPLIGETGPITEIGDIPANFSTMPWSCIFGNIFYGGFLPLNGAIVYNFMMHFVFLFAAAYVICRFLKNNFTTSQALTICLLLCAHFSFMYSFFFGNAGGILCCMLIISILITKKHPYIAGVFLGLAMLKPQIAAIICIIFLLNGRWKTLFTAAAIDIAGWAVTSIVTGVSPVKLLIETFVCGTSSPEQYLGLFSALHHAGAGSGIVLMVNVIIGIAYSVILRQYLITKGVSKDSVILYAPACIASTFWIYKNGTDYMILAFASIFFMILMLKKAMSFKDIIISFLCIAYLEMSRCAVYIGVALFSGNFFAEDLVKGGDGLIILIVGIILCKLWTKYNADNLIS